MEVDMDVSGVHQHHHQQDQMCSQTLESMLVCNKAQQADKKPRPPEEALNCPRCDSSNTKFCYYNNYSLTQPRYFCKSCRRYWTKGGTLRNVPVGGGCRKNKRSSSSSSSISAVAAAAASSNSSSSSALSKIRGPQDHHIMQQHHHHAPPHPLDIITSNSNNPLLSGLPFDSTCTDLSLAFARLHNQANGHLGYDQFDHTYQNSNNTLNPQGDHLGFLDAIRGGFLETNGFHNGLYNGGNIGNGDMGNLGNGGILMGLNNCSNNHDEDQEILNPMFHDHQETCGAATMAVTTSAVKQETCNMTRSSESGGGVFWGFPWQMGAGGGGEQVNMVHEVEAPGRWNGIGSTTWHGLINSPLM